MPADPTGRGRSEQIDALMSLLSAAQALTAPARPLESARHGSHSVEISSEEWARHVVNATLERLVTRFPKPGQRCPFTGLSRNQIYDLSKPAPGKKPIRTVSLKEPGERSGARFFFIGSALERLSALADEQAEEQRSNLANKKN